MQELITERFEALTGHAPTFIVRAPGRVNIIGEHTDYNNGLVLPGAIEQALWFAVRPNGEAKLRFWALDIDQHAEFSFTGIKPTGELWQDYLLGIAYQFQRRGHTLLGLDVVFGGNLPVGAGVSSSAALESGMVLAWNKVLDAKYTKPDLARLTQQSSNQFVGVPCGIMDQFASLNGRKDEVILLDCRDLSFSYHSVDVPGASWLLINSKVSHNLADSEYPKRVAECKAAVAIVQQQYSDVQSLRDVTSEMLQTCREVLPAIEYRRAKYVVEEHQRTLAMTQALARGAHAEVGQLLLDTHRGLSEEYEVSCPEIETLIEVAENTPGVYGARIMGGGFGGCTLSLVKDDVRDAYIEKALDALAETYGIQGEALGVVLADGAAVVD